MIQVGRSLRLALKAPQRGPVAEHVTQHDLDSNLAIKAQIRRFVNRAHPATADHPLQAIGVFAKVPTLSGGLCCLWKRNRAFGAYRDAPAGCANDSLCGVAGVPSSKTLARFSPSEDRRLTDLERNAIEAGELSRKKIAALADSTGTLVSIIPPTPATSQICCPAHNLLWVI
jgi:hypothetical protein